MSWKKAVLDAINRQIQKNGTFEFTRPQLIENQLAQIIIATNSKGDTPKQTLSRELQEIRDLGIISFNPEKDGLYQFLGKELVGWLQTQSSEQLIELDLKRTTDGYAIQKARIGQGAVRVNALTNYQSTCALCYVSEPELLVASHIVRWADMKSERLKPDNVLCLCIKHDALFEKGYIGLSSHYDLIINGKKKPNSKGLERWLEDCPARMMANPLINPNPEYLKMHRERVGI